MSIHEIKSLKKMKSKKFKKYIKSIITSFKKSTDMKLKYVMLPPGSPLKIIYEFRKNNIVVISPSNAVVKNLKSRDGFFYMDSKDARDIKEIKALKESADISL